MNKSISNGASLFIIFLISVTPFWAYLSATYLGRSHSSYTYLISYCIVLLIFLREKNIVIPTYLLYYFLFVLYTIISDKFFVGTDVISVHYVLGNSYLGGLALLFILEYIRIPDWFYKKIFQISLLIILIAFVVILIQQFISTFFFVDPEDRLFLSNLPFTQYRLLSIYSWSGNEAIIGLSFFPILAVLIDEFLIKQRNIVWFLFIVGAIVAFLNKSRYVMLNFFIIFLLIPVRKGFNYYNFFKYLVISVFVAVTLYFGTKTVGFDVDSIINERILEKSKGGMIKGSAGTRILAFEIFGELFPKNPIWGKGKFHGFGESKTHDIELVRLLSERSSQIHVGYLSLFYYYGLVGGVIYLLFLFNLTRKLVRDAKITNYWGPFVGWIMFLITNLTLVSLSIFIMGILIILFFNQYYIEKTKSFEENHSTLQHFSQ